MAVNYAQLRNLNARQIISALIRDGFTFDRGSGSHQFYYHADGRLVVVFNHAAQSFGREGVARSVKRPVGRKRILKG